MWLRTALLLFFAQAILATITPSPAFATTVTGRGSPSASSIDDESDLASEVQHIDTVYRAMTITAPPTTTATVTVTPPYTVSTSVVHTSQGFRAIAAGRDGNPKRRRGIEVTVTEAGDFQRTHPAARTVVSTATGSDEDIPVETVRSTVRITKTRAFKDAHSTETLFSTVTISASEGGPTKTIEAEPSVSTAYTYAACATNNILGPKYDPNQKDKKHKSKFFGAHKPYDDTEAIIPVDDAKSPYDCCVACHENILNRCLYSAFSEVRGKCEVVVSTDDTCDNMDYVAGAFEITEHENNNMSVYSNGPCGRMGDRKKQHHKGGFAGFVEDVGKSFAELVGDLIPF